jgi:hypothetical protein
MINLSAMLVAAALTARQPHGVPSCHKDLGGRCCLPSQMAPRTAFVRQATRALATLELRNESSWTDGPTKTAAASGKLFVVVDRPVGPLDVKREWSWAPTIEQARARWRPGHDVPMLQLEVDKEGFQDREGHPAVLVHATWVMARSAKPEMKPADPGKEFDGSVTYCVSSTPAGPRVAMEYDTET